MLERFSIILVLCFALMGIAQAQENKPILSLDTETTDLQTGQEYLVNLRLSNADSIWLVSAELSYDPSHLYIIGTVAGRPMIQGELFPFDQSVEVSNFVRGTALNYLVSRIAPAQAIDGHGIVAQFRIYPLAAGDVEISFADAELNRVVFAANAEGTRIPNAPEVVRPAVTVLSLRISGETVAVPSEASATPTATPTLDAPNVGDISQIEPTLEVVEIPSISTDTTSSPDATTNPMPATDTSSDSILFLGIGLVFAALVGGVFMVMMRRKK